MAAPHYFRRPLFSPHEVFCTPASPTQEGPEGFTVLQCPAHDYDLAALIAKLPESQKPDIIIVKIDAAQVAWPRNLRSVPGKKILLMDNTHSFSHPIAHLLHYNYIEEFDIIISNQDRHHVHFFVESGFDNIYWIPALGVMLRTCPLPEAPRPAPLLRFVGQTEGGQTEGGHRYHTHALERLKKADLPFESCVAAPDVTAALYADATIALNCSLNGDLNLRIFEILAAGGFLLTDALAPESGLEVLFTPGVHLDTYRTADELIEKARYYLSQPHDTLAIRRAGQQRVLTDHSPQRQLARFYDLVCNGRADDLMLPQLEIKGSRPVLIGPVMRRNPFQARVAAYESLQEWHARALSLKVYCDTSPSAPEALQRLADDVRDLPRLSVHALAELAASTEIGFLRHSDTSLRDEQVLVLPWPGTTGNRTHFDALLAVFGGGAVLVLYEQPAERAAVIAAMATWGLTPVDDTARLFACTDPFTFAGNAAGRVHVDIVRRKLEALLPVVATAGTLFRAAEAALQVGLVSLAVEFLKRSIGMDRHHQPALLRLAQVLETYGQAGDAGLVLCEMARIAPLAAEDEARRQRLLAAGQGHPGLESYRSLLRPAVSAVGATRWRILVITNLFPPQEMGGYGRKLWEFTAELIQRGHEVRVLTADATYLTRDGMAGTDDIESHVDRSIELYGGWHDGRVTIYGDNAYCLKVVATDRERILRTVDSFRPDVCLVGNTDLMGYDFMGLLVQRGLPVMHSVGSAVPGFPAEFSLQSPLYRIAPASDWVGQNLKPNGYNFSRYTVLYPGVRADYFYKHFLPVLDKPRIAYASLVLPYKGPHTLMSALAILQQNNIDFECTVAGDTTDPKFVDMLRAFTVENTIADKVRFIGFQDRAGLRDLFARNNLMVFPSIVKEAFGISQLEGMASGLAAVTTATGGGIEIIRDGIDGLIFPAENPLALAEKIALLAKNRALWGQLAENARKRAFEFAVARSVDVIEQTFAELLALKDSRSR